MTETDQIHSDIEAATRALAELVGGIIAYDAAVRVCVEAGGSAARVIAFAAVDPERAAFDSLMRNPIRISLREGIRRVGREVYRLGGLGTLHDTFHAVIDMVPDNGGRCAAILDSAFNGIGSGDDRWWS